MFREAALVLLCAFCGLIPAIQLPSRLAASRVLYATPPACQQCAPVCMCDAAEAEPAAEAAPVEAAADDAEPSAPPPPKKGKLPIEELEVGATVEGKIRSVQSYGAFVDIGATSDGLLHVSEMSDEFVSDANEMFKAGDTVSCRIKMVNLEKKQVALTKKDPSAERPKRKGRPDLSEYESADPKAFVTGKVNSLQSYGAFITLKEGVDGLVHISAIQEGGVSSVEDVLEVGQEVQVRIINFDKGKRRIGLSMKPFVEGEEDAPQGGRGKRERKPRFDRDAAEDDTPYQMAAEELDELGFEYEDATSDFAAAFSRAENVQKLKAEKGRYEKIAL